MRTRNYLIILLAMLIGAIPAPLPAQKLDRAVLAFGSTGSKLDDLLARP